MFLRLLKGFLEISLENAPGLESLPDSGLFEIFRVEGLRLSALRQERGVNQIFRPQYISNHIETNKK